MMRMATIVWVTVLLPGAAMSAVDDMAIFAEREPVAALTQAAVDTQPPSTETLNGVVDSIDQRSDAIRLRLPSGAMEQLKVQDGLMFDAVRFGDAVEVVVQSVDGFRTIVTLLEK